MDLELMLRFARLGARFHAIDVDLAIFRMGGISQTSRNRRYKEMKEALVLNGRNAFETAVFIAYVHLRTWTRDLLNMINPDLKNRLIGNTVK